MRVTYPVRFQVRTYETDQHARLQDGFLINYLQEAATQASSQMGFTMQWYFENKMLWLLRKLTLRYYEPAHYLDELEVTTWISDLKRVQSHREYDMRRLSDGAKIVRARANWAFVSLETMQLHRVPEAFRTAFGDHHEELEDLSFPVDTLNMVQNSLSTSEKRTVEYSEIDMVGHVNNGVYPRWTEQAARYSLRAMGLSAALPFNYVWREIEYFKAAQLRDEVYITSNLTAANDHYIYWEQQVHLAATHEALIREKSVMTREPDAPMEQLLSRSARQS